MYVLCMLLYKDVVSDIVGCVYLCVSSVQQRRSWREPGNWPTWRRKTASLLFTWLPSITTTRWPRSSSKRWREHTHTETQVRRRRAVGGGGGGVKQVGGKFLLRFQLRYLQRDVLDTSRTEACLTLSWWGWDKSAWNDYAPLLPLHCQLGKCKMHSPVYVFSWYKDRRAERD